MLLVVNFLFIVITLTALICVLLDKFSWKQDRNDRDYFVGLSYDLLPIMLIIMVVRTYMFEPFSIPSESMYPQLTEGNIIVVSKSSYALKFPFTNLPVVRLNQPKRGEVAVFKYPLDPNTYFIKRVIGIPGDKLMWEGDNFYINGKMVEREPAIVTNDFQYGLNERYSWELLGERKYKIRRLSNDDSSRFSVTSPFVILKSNNNDWSVLDEVHKKLELTVPQGNYFMMGDNRDMSTDGRVWGFVSEDLMVGQAKYIVMHINQNQPIWKFWKKVTFEKNLKIE